jgi:tetratricopeptide (TPR) repeat protein
LQSEKLVTQTQQKIEETQIQQLITQVKDYENKLAFFQGEKGAVQSQIEGFKLQEQSYQKKIDELTTTILDREKSIIESRQSEKGILAKADEYIFKIKDLETKLSELQKTNTDLQTQFQDYKVKEQAWRIKNDEFAVVLQDKEKSIADLKKDEDNVISQVRNSQAKLKELEELNGLLYEKNKILTKDNRLLKQKVESYPRKLYQVALLKDRLLKENAVLHYNLGVYCIQKQEYNDAIAEFDKVLELNPNDAATHYNLGIVYADYLNDKTKAILHFKRYLAINPNDKDAERAKKYILTWETWEDEKIERHR